MKKAPMTCPKCGEEKGWFCIDQPETPWFKDWKLCKQDLESKWFLLIHAVFFSLRGLAFLIIKAFVHAKPVHYLCGKCGYKGTYRQD